jgi:hypothetical protein
MNDFINALNKPVDAFHSGNRLAAWLLVGLTILINSVFAPILSYFANGRDINFLTMLMLTLGGVGTYLVISILFWLICRAFGSRTGLKKYIQTWGFTYLPTVLCSIVVAVTEVYFYVFWNSIFWGMFFNIVFGGILIWKTILYVLYLREMAGLRGLRLAGAFVTIGIFIYLLAFADGYLGIMTPVL